MNMNVQTLPIRQRVLKSLHDLNGLIATSGEAANVWRQLAIVSIIIEAPAQDAVLSFGEFVAKSCSAEGPFEVVLQPGAKARIFVTGGGIRLTTDAGASEFVKLGDQANLSGAANVRVDPVSGYGEVSFICVSEGDRTEIKAIESGGGADIDAPYYWGYDKRYAQTYEEGALTRETMEPNEIVTRLVPELISDKESETIVDLGCGEGRDSIWLASQGYHVTGVDVSSVAINRARDLAQKQGLSLNLMERDVIYLRGIEKESYALALNMGCLHMLDSDGDRRRHLERVFEILKPGGRFVVNHCKESWLKGFWSIEEFDAVKHAVPGDVIPRRIRTADGGTKTVDMEVLRHKVMNDEELKAEPSSVGFVDTRVLEENRFTFGNSSILVCRRP